jgi:transposase
VSIDVSELIEDGKAVAVLGVDLGIKKAVCTTLVTPSKVRATRYFKQERKARLIEKYDIRVAALQRELYTRKNMGVPYDGIAKELRRIRHKRLNLSRSYDNVLITQLLKYIEELGKDYTLYVSIGRLKGIRALARRGNYRGRRFRGMIHSWAFARISETLKFKLELLGWKTKGKQSRFRAVPEQWTSILCWRCGAKGKRPQQNHFHCTTCGLHTNADRNGAINIAHRSIKLTSFNDVRGLEVFARAFTRRKSSKAPERISKRLSKEKSLPSKKRVTSDSEGRGAGNTPCVRTMENLTVAGVMPQIEQQETEARTRGGTAFQ